VFLGTAGRMHGAVERDQAIEMIFRIICVRRCRELDFRGW